MTTSDSLYLAHHFDDREQQREAMTLGMWVFLVTEIMFFGGMFLAYAVYRWRFPEGFAEGSKHLDMILGTVNTGLLLVSSFTVALAVHAAQSSRGKAVAWLFGITILFGLAFLGIKGYEYWHKFHEHLVPGPHFRLLDPHNPQVDSRQVEIFLSLYFAMTGLHAIHMMIGIGVFVVMIVLAWRGRFSSEHYAPVEVVGLYWHFVDIVWVFLYPLLYLI
ncbi:MAG: cytochrome c oxidase subunit 3 family protein [Pirellulaceae bacterium]|nr:cytochrome c oxidase subunit 3 family protein [Planctomycetales bacterium]